MDLHGLKWIKTDHGSGNPGLTASHAFISSLIHPDHSDPFRSTKNALTPLLDARRPVLG